MKLVIAIIGAWVVCLFLVGKVSAEFISPAPRYITIEMDEYDRIYARLDYLEKVQRAYKKLKKTCRGAR